MTLPAHLWKPGTRFLGSIGRTRFFGSLERFPYLQMYVTEVLKLKMEQVAKVRNSPWPPRSDQLFSPPSWGQKLPPATERVRIDSGIR
ncbi:hypothetical protein NPIL_390281 [Nephila pilipes]|uniref:Uncharacterized protein n=1 Tax=Nephila pilipes TaxID=299642 RepID=A0A8X6NH37_NEPPI|nr:hypothetical protein NPIL_390281 [Nephila pilipes]